MDSLDDSGLAVPGMSTSHGSIKLSATLDSGICNFSRDTVLKGELLSNECWRESGLVGSFDAVRSGNEEGRSIMLG